MKNITIIDSNGTFLEPKLQDLNNGFSVTVIQEKNIETILNQLNGNITETDVVLINLENGFDQSKRSALKGVDLIFWLRYKYKLTGHIITYGFLPAPEVIRQNPENVVIHAPGNYHLQLPGLEGLEKVVKNFKSLDEKQIKKLYKPFAEKFVDIHQARHEKANWWAVKTMWDIDDIKKYKHAKKQYPEFVKEKLNSLNNYLISQITSSDSIRLDDYVTQLTNYYHEKLEVNRNKRRRLRKRRKEIGQERESQINELKDYIENLMETIESSENLIDKIKNEKNDVRKYANLKIDDPRLKSFDEQIEIEENYIEEVKIEIEEIKQKMLELASTVRINDYFEEEQQVEIESIEEDESLKKLVNLKVPDKKREILLIDDMAEQGWLALYEKIFGDNFNFIDFNGILGDLEHKIIKLKGEIRKKIIEKNPKFIILDIRLFPEDNLSDRYREYSGFQILDYLRENFPGIPVLVTSASNKIWSLQTSIRLGAHNYWMKEGLDNHFSKEDSIANYIELIDSINNFNHEQYRFLAILNKLYSQIKNEDNPFWWENYTWNAICVQPKGQTTIIDCSEIRGYNICKINKKHILSILKDGIDQLNQLIIGRNFLKLPQFENSILAYRNITIRIGKIIELIHPKQTHTKNRTAIRMGTMDVINSKGDLMGAILRRDRNNATHKNFNTGNFKKFLERLSNYLTKDPIIKFSESQEELMKQFEEEKLTKQKVEESTKQEKAKQDIIDVHNSSDEKTEQKPEQLPKQEAPIITEEIESKLPETQPKTGQIEPIKQEEDKEPVEDSLPEIEKEEQIGSHKSNIFIHIIQLIKKLFSKTT